MAIEFGTQNILPLCHTHTHTHTGRHHSYTKALVLFLLYSKMMYFILEHKTIWMVVFEDVDVDANTCHHCYHQNLFSLNIFFFLIFSGEFPKQSMPTTTAITIIISISIGITAFIYRQ